ncbi:hypothetical protein LJY25_12495 [Hymenobacter sp. BT175]|uniref:SRPBCC family protein n=1 Tax=Hymenobacter translucens TaxID=2886507 RepID=UPI001D0F2F5A|nr:SRPBCC family protein [Hymenobacter translucens]MCC2547267.1 hypothetical protein [Hymenobacter translucens]
MSLLRTLCLLSALLTAFAGAASPPPRAEDKAGWHLETDKDGIRVYSRFLPNSRLKEIRVHCEMPGTLSQLVALYSDVDNYPQVISRTRTARLLRRPSETELYYYLETDMPPPVADRDLVMHLQFAYDAGQQVLVMNTTAANGLVAPQAGLVRIPYWSGKWQVRPVGSNRLQIDYTFLVDPGGELPAWLVNMVAPVAPYQSFVQLRDALQLPRYQGRSFSFISPAARR